MTALPFDHPFLSGLLGDAEISAQFSAKADIAAMVRFEITLARGEADAGVIGADAADAIERGLADFKPDFAALRDGVAQDGVVIPALVEAMRQAVGNPHGEKVHFGATSQDAIDTSLALRLGDVLGILEERLRGVVAMLQSLEAAQGGVEVMAHTRMQAAIPVTAARKIASWRLPLERHLDRLETVRRDVLVLTFGGAAGTLEKLGDKGPAVRARMAAVLGLRDVEHPHHSERDGQAALANWLSLVTGSLGKMGQDIALMAQNEVGAVKLASGGGSSAMPHKQNPVGAEVLVTLARFNATLLAGMHQSLVHENERSGAAWTLEWMLLPQMAVATGVALRNTGALLDGLEFRPLD
ncbi:3-carboxy-cis,cis-muconate cycloisomerase [Mesorhizobium sp. YIM 152430]|uniref:3-carboxy-cis,cis-muconate cycloisomerase n=1 Tax=Mesorhizobium sp. YIM 152430 TaxID=3031761 RepID=UPI0023D97A19|nr:3-carboxy-cis,cis-muconate cycloisomerase [Mesorhizobium sp. YIM 152430]MDF1598416.1 3-carboxy-cis,cis-muconate cycloisomerase [Mesorhizobium sp. YIM 152430]